jgi:tRNA A37 threonylcarbamoyladenosine synthetase subunit TsaC/SUA5/YrdC
MAGTEPDIVYLKASDEFSVDDVEKAGQVLHGGGVIALPTDTLYGVASLAQSSDGIRRLYEVKQRDTKKPLAICVGEIEDINRYNYPLPLRLCDKFLD